MGIPTGRVNKITGVKNNTTNMQNNKPTTITGSNNTQRNNNNTSINGSLGPDPTSSATVSTVQRQSAKRMLAKSKLILQTAVEFLCRLIASDHQFKRPAAVRLEISNLINHRFLTLRT